MIESIGALLPEQSNAGAAYLSETYSPNLVISEPANIDVTFLWEGAGYRNTLGWFTYQDLTDGGVEVLHSSLLMPDASFPPQGSSLSGDTFFLKNPDGSQRVFEAGERVAFFLVADGWNKEPLIKNWIDGEMPLPSSDPAVNATFGRGCFTTLDKLNPEQAENAPSLARHLAMIWMPAVNGFMGGEPYLVCGFEDIKRTHWGCDNDFNDLVFLVSASPIEALDETEAFNFEPGDPDGDLITGANDHFPQDPTRAFVVRVPPTGHRVVGFEDRYPWIGDADYNDAVLAWSAEQITDAQGRIKNIEMTVHLVARGATYEHALGVHLPGLPSGVQGTYSLERVLSGDEPMGAELVEKSIAAFISEDSRRVPLFPSTSLALPPTPGNLLTNTFSGGIDRGAASARFSLAFDVPISPEILGSAPYDLYLSVDHTDGPWDIHFPGYAGFPERPGYLPDETGPGSYLDESGNPWVIEIPQDWRFPLEQVAIWNAYPEFLAWTSSEGQVSAAWYDSPTSQEGFLSAQLFEYLPQQSWSIGNPLP